MIGVVVFVPGHIILEAEMWSLYCSIASGKVRLGEVRVLSTSLYLLLLVYHL